MHFHIESQKRQVSETATNFSVDISSILSNSAKGAGTVAFRDISLPYTWYNLVGGLNNSFTFVFSDASSKTVYLGALAGSNTGISTILSNIQTSINTNTSGQIFTVSIDTTTARVKFQVVGGSNNFTVQLLTGSDPDVWKVLGFAYAGDFSSSTGLLLGNNVVSVERYKNLYLHVQGLGIFSHDFENSSNRTSSIVAKIPVVGPSVGFFGWIYFNPGRPNFRVTNELQPTLKVRLCDIDGNLINLNGGEWSFTLEFNRD